MSSRGDDTTGISRRVTALEGDVRALGENVRDMRTDVANLGTTLSKSFDELQRSREIDRQALTTTLDRFQQTRLEDFRAAKTPWTAMISAAAALVTILGLVGGLAVIPLQMSISRLTDVQDGAAAERRAMSARLSYAEAKIDERAVTLGQINERIRAVEGNRWTAEQHRLYEASVQNRLDEIVKRIDRLTQKP